jgi:hypothetical protein
MQQRCCDFAIAASFSTRSNAVNHLDLLHTLYRRLVQNPSYYDLSDTSAGRDITSRVMMSLLTNSQHWASAHVTILPGLWIGPQSACPVESLSKGLSHDMVVKMYPRGSSLHLLKHYLIHALTCPLVQRVCLSSCQAWLRQH